MTSSGKYDIFCLEDKRHYVRHAMMARDEGPHAEFKGHRDYKCHAILILEQLCNRFPHSLLFEVSISFSTNNQNQNQNILASLNLELFIFEYASRRMFHVEEINPKCRLDDGKVTRKSVSSSFCGMLNRGSGN